MTQITGGFSASDAHVGMSAAGVTFVDISGSAASVAPGEQTRKSGEVYTHSGDTAIITGGKREPLEVEIKIVYTEGTGDPFEVIRAAFEAKTPYYFRWSPKGYVTGAFTFTSDAAVITGLTYPDTDAGTGDPCMCAFKFKTAKVTKSALVT